MANSYASADVVAAWLFEASPGILKDSKSIQPDLTASASPPTADTTNQMEGAQCASFAAASQQYYTITNANLITGFPLKSGDTGGKVTINCWARPTTVDANKRRIWGKSNTTGNQRSLCLYHNSTALYLAYSPTGTAFTEISLRAALVANQKYFISISIDISNLFYWARIYDVTAGTWISKAGTITGLFLSTADWRLGSDDNPSTLLCFDGQIDEMVVWKSRLHNSEALAAKGGTYPVAAGTGIYDWFYDPSMAADTYDGFSAAATAYKTLKHAIGANDIIHAAQCVEVTKQTGNGTATNGSASVTGITGWTPAQYDIIRFVGDDTLYMVKAWTAGTSTITLYRPYEGSTSSTKTINLLTLITVASADWTPTTFTGTVALPITFNGGMNLATLSRDGFTIVNGNSANNAVNASLAFWTMNNFGFYYFYAAWNYLGSGGPVDCTFNNHFLFRMVNQGIAGYGWTRITANIIVAELSKFPGGALYNCVLNDVHTAEASGTAPSWNGTTPAIDTIVNRWKNVGASSIAWAISGMAWGLRFVDAVFDPTGTGCQNILMAAAAAAFCEDVVFHNPTLGAGTVFGLQSTAYTFNGEINLVNVGGSATDHRSFFGAGPTVTTFITIIPDYDIYNTAAPSVKVTLPGGASAGPFYQRHYVPCEAGIARTISAYLRKNSSYGSAGGANIAPAWALPFMRLRWITGAAGSLVHNVYDVAMADVDNTFELVSHQVTPSIKGVIIVEFYFTSPNAGAIAWYDDLAG